MPDHSRSEQISRSKLARKAVQTHILMHHQASAANLLRDSLDEIDKLAQHCQLTEFTEHGLPHLHSLIQRVDDWTLEDGRYLVDTLSNDEAFLLCFAVLIHDIGMLSQNQSDLSDEDRQRFALEFANLPTWVRRTHVPRLEGVFKRLLEPSYGEFVKSPVFKLACALARTHQAWPEPKKAYFPELDSLFALARIDSNPERMKGLAGVLAVADLL